jgi:hypothetical protein
MKRRCSLVGVAVVAATLSLVTACGASDDNPPPTLGDPAVRERPGGTTATTSEP